MDRREAREMGNRVGIDQPAVDAVTACGESADNEILCRRLLPTDRGEAYQARRKRQLVVKPLIDRISNPSR